MKIGEGRRNDHLARVAGALNTQGVGTEAIAVALMAENEERCDPPLNADEVGAIAASISRYDAPEPAAVDEEPEPLRRPVPPAAD